MLQKQCEQIHLTNSVGKDVIASCLDGITSAMTANYELNQRRRDTIRPCFKLEFAKGLCTSASPINEYLFGGDIAKKVKEISELNKNKLCKNTVSFRSRGGRYQPYPQRKPFNQAPMRGRFQRSRGFCYVGSSQQR